MKTALICGVSGQDGAYLSALLLSRGYRVIGASRDAQTCSFRNLSTLGIVDDIERISMNPADFGSVIQTLTRIKPDEVYNLSGQSSVALSFDQPVETLESIVTATLNLLEAIRVLGAEIRFYNAGSGECFGNTEQPADELTAFRPRSPYAVSKAAAFWQVANYRQAYGLHACTGLLFNHESPLRPERFVTRKVVRAAARIAAGSREQLRLGNIGIMRDWGWAPDYVEAMWKMLQTGSAQDFVIATGETHRLSEFVERVFAAFGLNWNDHVSLSDELARPDDVLVSRANPALAARLLGWTPTHRFDDVVRLLTRAEA